jgi:N-acetylmuramoyl-L-alanine amidase
MSVLGSRFASAMWLAVVLLSPARAVDLHAIRLWAGPDGTRVVVDLSGSAPHSLQVLKDPDRVVLEVAGARLASHVRAAPAAAGVVKKVRMARRSSGELRIVLDLGRPVQ